MSDDTNDSLEEQQYPVNQKVALASSTALAMGLLDWIAHFGPTGLVVGGLASYVAWKHGPELYEQVRGVLPRPAQREQAKQGTQTARPPRGRSWFERAFAIPAEEDEAETTLVDEPEALSSEPARPSRQFFTEIMHPIRLSRELVVEANEIVGAGINIFGVKGSGKTGTVARLAEQFARYQVSEVLFDIKGDLDTLVTDRREDGRPYVPHGFVGVRGRAPRGRSVLRSGLQVVYDLRTWQTPEQMANLICVIVEELLDTVATTPEGELAPCLVFLDEAEYWLPQSQPSYLYPRTYKRLLDAFHMLATMGRSRGLAPVIATQRIAKVNKDIIAQAEMNVFMKAMLDIDLDRYSDYFNKTLVSRERIRGFQAGEAVVCLPDGSQTITRLLPRESRHRSHTPHVEAALKKFQQIQRGPVELDGEMGGVPPPAAIPTVPSAEYSPRRVTAPAQARPQDLLEVERSDMPHVEPINMKSAEPQQPPRMGRVDLQKNKVLLLALQYIRAGANGPRPLARAMGVSVSTAKSYIDRLQALGEL